jgi:hypothetical protein
MPTDLRAKARKYWRAVHRCHWPSCGVPIMGPLGMTDWTSLKVPRYVRDRLATVARARGLTVRALVDDLSRKVADDTLMEQAATQVKHLRDTSSASWAEYVQEGMAWEQGTLERIDT